MKKEDEQGHHLWLWCNQMKSERILKVVLSRRRNKNERCNEHISIRANTTSTNKGEGENSSLIYRITTRKMNDEEQYWIARSIGMRKETHFYCIMRRGSNKGT